MEVGGNQTYAGLKLVLTVNNHIVNLNSFTALHYSGTAVIPALYYSSQFIFIESVGKVMIELNQINK